MFENVRENRRITLTNLNNVAAIFVDKCILYCSIFCVGGNVGECWGIMSGYVIHRTIVNPTDKSQYDRI